MAPLLTGPAPCTSPTSMSSFEPVVITPSGNDVDYSTKDPRHGITKSTFKSLKSQNPAATMAGFAAPSDRPPVRQPEQTHTKRKQADL